MISTLILSLSISAATYSTKAPLTREVVDLPAGSVVEFMQKEGVAEPYIHVSSSKGDTGFTCQQFGKAYTRSIWSATSEMLQEAAVSASDMQLDGFWSDRVTLSQAGQTCSFSVHRSDENPEALYLFVRQNTSCYGSAGCLTDSISLGRVGAEDLYRLSLALSTHMPQKGRAAQQAQAAMYAAQQ